MASAYAFDLELANFSNDYIKRNIPECPAAPYISNEDDLRAVMNAIQRRVIDKLQIHEYFMIDIEKAIEKLKSKIKDQPASFLERQQRYFDSKKTLVRDHLQLLNEEWVLLRGAERMKVKVNMTQVASFLYLANGRNEAKAVQQARALFQRYNEEWKATITKY